MSDADADDLFDARRGEKKKTRSEAVSEGIRRRKANGLHYGAQRRFDYGEIRRLWNEGKSFDEIKTIVGCQTTTIMNAINEISKMEKEI